MNLNVKCVLFALGIGTLLAGCQGSQSDPLPPAVAQARHKHPAVNVKLVAADTRFGFSLFQHLVEAQPADNVFVSPVSIALALQMTYNGAKGETKIAMERAMALQGMSLDTIAAANAALLATLTDPGSGVTLDIGNSLWLRRGASFEPDFLKRNRDFYGAQIGDLTGAPDTVNRWVSDKTHGKIPTILQSQDVTPATTAVLVNAVYFKGDWEEAFPKSATESRPFTLPSGIAKSCPMMHLRGTEKLYTQGSNYQAIALPYQGGRDSMIVVLPNAKTSLSALIAQVTPNWWATLTQSLIKQKGDLRLPRFTSEYEAGLNAPLKALGMGVAFDPDRADFRGMVPSGGVWIGVVRHKTYVKVDEKGTEAAAATAVVMKSMLAMPFSPPFVMEVNRPFLCAIREERSGALLFLGVIRHPQK